MESGGIGDFDHAGLKGDHGSAKREDDPLAGTTPNALDKCLGQAETRRVVESVAAEAGFALSNFMTNATLELYYEIRHGNRNVAYISKGWDDPGFRVGEVVDFQELQGVSFLWTGVELKRYCATNGIGITFEQRGETTGVQLDGVIYREGFNAAVLLKTVDALMACTAKLRALGNPPGAATTC
jgi:hypothetical protein